jgi:hypothetical protein
VDPSPPPHTGIDRFLYAEAWAAVASPL